MKFGVNTFIWSANCDESLGRLFPEVKRRGFDGVEVPLFDPKTFPSQWLKGALADHGLGMTACAVFTKGLSLVSEDPTIRQRTLDHFRGCAEVMAEAGASLIIGPLHATLGDLPGRRRTDDEWKRCVEGYQQLGPVFEQHGVHIAIEPLNRFETYFLNTAADSARLCDEIGHDHVGILIDTFHSNIEEKSLRTALLTAGRHLKHVHASENDRGIPGSGQVDWQVLFPTLREMGYEDWVTIESFGFAIPELTAAASIWRDLAPSPEAIAYEGIEFLRGQAGR